MSQLIEVCEILKSTLKQQGITYKALAQQLGMSEANVKRMFSLKQFSLVRLEEICEVAGISLSDLFVLVEEIDHENISRDNQNLFYELYVSITDLVLLLVVLTQTLLNMFSGEPSGSIQIFGKSLGVYLQQISEYLSYASDEKPFPFSDWPVVEDQIVEDQIVEEQVVKDK